eukprot:363400-Chlamydomonas_euryale.AAC.1
MCTHLSPALQPLPAPPTGRPHRAVARPLGCRTRAASPRAGPAVRASTPIRAQGHQSSESHPALPPVQKAAIRGSPIIWVWSGAAACA